MHHCLLRPFFFFFFFFDIDMGFFILFMMTKKNNNILIENSYLETFVSRLPLEPGAISRMLNFNVVGSIDDKSDAPWKVVGLFFFFFFF